MPRNFLKFIVLGAAASLAGCDGSESTSYPEDGRAQSNPINNTEDGTLSGRALVDGYLDGAFVWLDVNENGRLDEGEPAAKSGVGGHFQLDTSSLERDISVGPDLDSRDYPLMLLATDGMTIDEKYGVPVTQNFLLLAPPGVSTITPFTTLIEFERRLPGFSLRGDIKEEVRSATARVKTRLGEEPSGFSLNLDYRLGGNNEAAAYGRAITALIAAQTHVPLGHTDPRTMLRTNSFNILAGAVLGQVADVVAQTTGLMSAGVENFHVDDLELPLFELPDEDPFVLYQQRLYMNSEFTPDSDLDSSDPLTVFGSKGSIAGRAPEYLPSNLSTELSYFYDETGRLVEIQVDGWTEPSLVQLYPLVQAGGYIANLGTQYGPGLLLRYSSAFARGAEQKPRERYIFNWDDPARPVIEWQTNNNGTAVPGALGGPAEAVFYWDEVTEILSSDYAAEGSLKATYADGFPQRYEFGTGEIWSWTDATPADPEFQCDQVTASGEQFWDTYPLETGQLTNSTRAIAFGAEERPVEWMNAYRRGSEENPLEAGESLLFSERTLSLLAEPATGCDLRTRAENNRVLAVSIYQHMHLSTRLAGQSQQD